MNNINYDKIIEKIIEIEEEASIKKKNLERGTRNAKIEADTVDKIRREVDKIIEGEK